MQGNLVISLVLLTSFLAMSPAAFASATWYVNGVGGSDSNDCLSPATACKTIGRSISLATSGDTIRVAAAIYTENLTITISLKLLGASASTTVLDGGGRARAVTISSGISVTLSGVTITHGYATSGAGILNNGVLQLLGSIVTGNGAAISCKGYCFATGGGITNSGQLILLYSTIASNRAFAKCYMFCSAFGGGIWNGGSLTIDASTINGNSVSVLTRACYGRCHRVGSGIYNNKAMVATNSTFTSNNGMAAIYNNSNAKVKLSSSTISGNTDIGIDNQGGAATLQNTLVANNHGDCANDQMISDGYNLSSDGTCNFTGPGDLNNTNPMLGPLQNNGGPTKTMALLPGSPAIDAGNPGGCTDGQGHLLNSDQRGMPRPDSEDSGGCDLGAYERQSD